MLPISIGISQIVMALFFAKPLFEMKLLTLPDLWAIQFGRACELAFCVVFFISFVPLLGAQASAQRRARHLRDCTRARASPQPRAALPARRSAARAS